MNTPAPAAGWYADPHGQAQSRYWDGAQWTHHVHPPVPNGNGAAPATPQHAADAGPPQLALSDDGDLAALGIAGADGLSVAQVNEELSRGARFVVYPYVVSLLIVTLRRGSNVYFVPAGKSAVPKGLPFAGISLVAGWWGFPWGFIFTPIAIGRVLTGGKNVTKALVQAVNEHVGNPAALIASAAAAEGPRSGVLQTVPEPAPQPAPQT